MRVARHRKFRKNFKSRVATNSKLTNRFEKRLALLVLDKNNPTLKDHKLSGSKKGFRAFSITGDVRVVYNIESGSIKLYDIGTHNQVY